MKRVINNQIKKINEALKHKGAQISWFPEKVEHYYRQELKQIRTNLKKLLK